MASPTLGRLEGDARAFTIYAVMSPEYRRIALQCTRCLEGSGDALCRVSQENAINASGRAKRAGSSRPATSSVGQQGEKVAR
jgi:hypothetical protein